MRLKSAFYSALFFALLGLCGIILSLTFRYPEAIALPLFLSSIIFIFATIEVSKELRGRDRRETAKEEKPPAEAESRLEMRRFGVTLAWGAGFSVGVYLLGFYLAIPLFGFSYMKWRGRSWLRAAVYAVGMLAFIYGAFELFLEGQLFKGLIFGDRP